MIDYKTKTKEHDFPTMQDLFLDAIPPGEITSPYWQKCYQMRSDNNLLFKGINRCWLNHNSCGRSRAATELWQCSLRRLVEEKQPGVLIIFGGDRATIPCDLGVPLIYCEDYITKHFRNCKTLKL